MNTDHDTSPPAFKNSHDTKTSLPGQSAPLLNEPGSNSITIKIPGQPEIKINPSSNQNVQNLEIQEDDRNDNSKSCCLKMCPCYDFRGRSCLYKWSCKIVTWLIVSIIFIVFVYFVLIPIGLMFMMSGP